MLFNPGAWRSGTQQANPFVIVAIGLAVTAFGFVLAFLRTTYLVDRSSNLLVKESRLIVPLRSASYRLSDFSHVEVRRDTDVESSARYRLVLVGTAQELILAGGSTSDALAGTRDAVSLAVFGVLPQRNEEEEDDDSQEVSGA